MDEKVRLRGRPVYRPRHKKKRRRWPSVLGGILVLGGIAYGLHPTLPRLPSGLPASYCDGIAKLRVTFQAASAGTLTPDELATQLADEENEIHGAALMLREDKSRAFTLALADAVGRFKVAVAAGGNLDIATQGLSNMLQVAPSC
jgi:hypothetical protein